MPPKNLGGAGSQLGPKPGSAKRNRQKNVAGLGRALVNNKNKSKRNAGAGDDRFTTEEGDDQPGWVKLQSVTQERPLDEFLSTAELADTDFTTERTAAAQAEAEGNVRIISHPDSKDSDDNPYLLNEQERQEQKVKQAENAGKLTVPRRPNWTKQMTSHELDRLEKDAFLDWRRELAKLQENQDLLLTPFERNLEVWRQLWRVVDRSDLIVQIVDARNPLLFRSEDLEIYVKQVDRRKNNLLLINKADLMTTHQRQAWAKYLNEQNIRYAFFSASTALQEVEEQEAKDTIEQEEEEEEEEEEDYEYEEEEQQNDNEKEVKEEPKTENYSVMRDDPVRILTVNQLEELFLSEAPEPMYAPATDENPGVLQIGLVGYPNVGKSSTINALIGSKKVSVSATPGKTKHFQTISLTPRVMLCDCPGLVFPNFAQTNADLVCNGVLPIDQLREYTGPTQLVTNRIPKFFLEAVYGITIRIKPIEDGGSGKPTANELLYSYAKARGFMRSGQGTPDESRASRYILKDYVNAKLLYCVPPPGYPDSAEVFNRQLYSLNSLPEQRRAQIVSAIHETRGDDVDLQMVDLAQELKTLKFAQHDPTQKHTTAMSNTERFSEGAELDQEFFATASMGHRNLPFHMQQQQKGNGKKHFKGGKRRK